MQRPDIVTFGYGSATKSMSTHLFVGNICRIQPNEIIFNTPSAYQSIYGSKANRDMRIANTLVETDRAAHAHKKRLLAAAFTEKAMHTAEDFVVQHVDRWCELLVDSHEEPKNMADLANNLVFDIMCDLAFGKSFDTKEHGENQLRKMPRVFDNYTSFMYKISRSPCFGTWLWLKSMGLDAALERFKPKTMSLLTTLIGDNMRRRIKEEEDSPEAGEHGRKDILHYLFHSKDPKTGDPAYSKEMLATEASLLLTGALGTTSNTISAFFFYANRNPHSY
ncbi:Cytochrome P450 monooxygenase apf7 [Lachnellula suecica]|uniref:Cytochrome P450 monooxygenase apf7 n=1 Tax=Lachnellula suecica TaxID=602035 RepID=A0A8T9C756_9HELO|nr:Cytochrome P450 monooxygenase apf7 [Lachnellula suecica]